MHSTLQRIAAHAHDVTENGPSLMTITAGQARHPITLSAKDFVDNSIRNYSWSNQNQFGGTERHGVPLENTNPETTNVQPILDDEAYTATGEDQLVDDSENAETTDPAATATRSSPSGGPTEHESDG